MTFKSLIKDINKKEWLVILFSWLTMVMISFISFVFAFHWLKQGYVISGMHNWYMIDVNIYFSYIKQVIDGKYLLDTIVTTENAMPMFRPFWLVLGLFGKVLHLSPLVTYLSGKIILLFFLLIVLHIFLQIFFKDKKIINIVFLITVFSTGLGIFTMPWISVLKYTSVDLWMPETSIFFSFLFSPHFIYVWTLLLLVYSLWFLLIKNHKNPLRRLGYSFLLGLISLFLFITHPFHIAPIYLITGLHFIYLLKKHKTIAKNIFVSYLLFIVLSFFGVFYHMYYVAFDWLTATKLLQVDTYSPNVIMIAFGFGLPFFIGYWQIFKMLTNKKQSLTFMEVFVIIWAIGQLLLAYFPVSWQRRMLQGLEIPLIILFGYWLNDFLIFKKQKKIDRSFIFIIFVIIVLLFSNSVNIVSLDAKQYKKGVYFNYYSADFYQAIKFINKNLNKNIKIFCSINSGNYLAGMTGRRVFAGHVIETAYFNSKMDLSLLFFKDNKNDERKYKLLKQYHITHLFYSPYEKKLGSFNPRQKKYLKLIYQNPEVEIYEILYK